jgi:hypothetical protein
MTEELVPRPKVARELGTTTRTICRYEVEKRPGFDRKSAGEFSIREAALRR